MKKAIILLLLAVPAIRGAAQLTVTPEIGYNKSTFYTNAPSTQISTGSLNGIQVGALLTQTWKKYIFIQTGLQFSQKGSYQGRGSQTVYGSNTDIKLNYLQIPLNIGVKVKLYKDFGVMASGGVYLAAGISGTEKGSSVEITGTSTVDRNVTFSNASSSSASSNNAKTYIKPFDDGYNLSAGIFFRNIDLKTTYSKGTPNVSPVGSTLYRNEVWNISVGYSFRLR